MGNFNKFCGKPPVHIVLYTLKPRMPAVSPEKEDTRHLDSYKNYYFHLAFWSSQAMPSSGRKAELLQGSVDQNQTMAGEEAMLRKRKKWYENHFQSVFGCFPAKRHSKVGFRRKACC